MIHITMLMERLMHVCNVTKIKAGIFSKQWQAEQGATPAFRHQFADHVIQLPT
jgi:hypothetical protein